jgi:tRNA G10  N-methylase Trm11
MEKLFEDTTIMPIQASLSDRAAEFCESAPYRQGPYAKRNWGGPLHSLCSYQGKLKPSIAHFLISWFTAPGDIVLDPLAGVGTIPLEARRLGRVGIGSDLSPLAVSVCRAKLEGIQTSDVWASLSALSLYLDEHADDSIDGTDVNFGLNGSIKDYFHEKTLREVVHSRRYFLDLRKCTAADEVVKSSLLHILHGNRPYALSRRSHPITPFAPSGPFIYRPVIGALGDRLQRILPHLAQLSDLGPEGSAFLADFRNLKLPTPVDAVITSPPFSKSFRFWSSNWMRLWFAGWEPSDFKSQPAKFLEVEQRDDFSVYGSFAASMAEILKPGGLLILHLGETAKVNMVDEITPFLTEHFRVHCVARESVQDTESHGLSDKGATVAHWYLFAELKH